MQKRIIKLFILCFRIWAWWLRIINKITPEILYTRMVRLIETIPYFDDIELSDETYRWLVDAHELVRLSGELTDLNNLKHVISALIRNSHLQDASIDQQESSARNVRNIISRVLLVAESKVSIEDKEFFIPAGETDVAFAVVSKIFNRATTEILIIDPYLDETLFTDFAPTIQEGVMIKLLVNNRSYNRGVIRPALEEWMTQHGTNRPIELKTASNSSLHDRLIIIDNEESWNVSQSFNNLAKTSPAIISLSPNPAPIINAFTGTWDNAEPIQP